jgi:hypothetical protein
VARTQRAFQRILWFGEEHHFALQRGKMATNAKTHVPFSRLTARRFTDLLRLEGV